MKNIKTHFLLVFGVVFLGTFFSSASAVYANDTGVISATVQLAVCGDGVKNFGEQCDLGDLNGKACNDFGYEGGSLGCSVACQFDTASCTTSATASAVATLVPTADRTYILPDDADSFGISLPQSFSANNLTMFLFSHASSPAAPAGESMVGKLYNLIFVNENGDTVHVLSKTSTVTLSYADMDLGTTDENTLAPYRSENGGTSWIAVPDYTLNKNAKTVTFNTNEFSQFSIFGLPVSIHVVIASGGGGGGRGNWVPPKATPEEKKKILKVADFNDDGVVDLSDLSILLYHAQTGTNISQYDLDGDKQLDIVDVSIMLYYWEVTS